MKNKELIRAIVIIVLAFGAGAGIYCLLSPSSNPIETTDNQNSYHSQNRGQGMGFGLIVKQLNFTQEQISAFSTIESQYRTATNLLVAKMDSLDKAIIKELTQNNPDRALLTQMAVASGKSQREIKQNTIEHFMALREICTPNQLQKYQQIFEQITQYQGSQGRGQGRGQRYRGGRP